MAQGPPKRGIRTLAICVFRRGNHILVARGFDDVKQEWFLRPLGGEVEFGETAASALRREIKEELGHEISDPVRLGVLENRFSYRGKPAHEIVFVFDARFMDETVDIDARLPIHEPVWEGPARWVDLDDPIAEPLYPDGLTTLLKGLSD